MEPTILSLTDAEMNLLADALGALALRGHRQAVLDFLTGHPQLMAPEMDWAPEVDR